MLTDIVNRRFVCKQTFYVQLPSNLRGNAVFISSLLAVSYMMDGKQIGNSSTSKLETVDFITMLYQ